MGFWNLLWLVATLTTSDGVQGLSVVVPAPSPPSPTLTQGVSPVTTGTLSVATGVSVSIVSPPTLQ